MNINYQTLILKTNGILEELKKAKYNDIKDLSYRRQLTSNEITDILGLKNIPTKKQVIPWIPVFMKYLIKTKL